MSTHIESELDSPHVESELPRDEAGEIEPDGGPRELESAFLSIAMFGGLILFGISCMVFGWG